MILSDHLLALLSDIPVNAVLRERLAGLAERVKVLESENAELVEENSRIATELGKAHPKRTPVAEDPDYRYQEGAFFKKSPRGGYEKVVYCPKCGDSASPAELGDSYRFRCGPCHWRSTFQVNDLPGILANLG